MSLTQVFLGLGSNIERETHLCAGLEALAGFLVDMRCSAVFESQPVGIKSGPFFNFVVSAFTDLPLMELDRRLKFIEADNGRYAPDRKGLPLDIDVLLYGEQVGNFDGLILPRAEILKNAFVLWPLSLIAPDRIHPGVGKALPHCGKKRRSTRYWRRWLSNGAASNLRHRICAEAPAAIASKYAPTLEFQRAHILCSAKIHCGSELARDDGGISGKNAS